MPPTQVAQRIRSDDAASAEMPIVRILDVPVHVARLDDAVQCMATWATEQQARYISTATVYTVMQAAQDPVIFKALANATMVTADGMPLVWSQRSAGYTHAERVYGPDILLALCRATAGNPVRHYFWGGQQETAQRLADRLQTQFPGLAIAGAATPPLYTTDIEVDAATVQRLNASNADIVWVGLGGPKQDVWMSRYRPHLKAPILIGVGAAFDFISGSKRQAPVWIQHSGLEWAFRLAQEPRRLASRYIKYNTLFLWSLLRRYPAIQREAAVSPHRAGSDQL